MLPLTKAERTALFKSQNQAAATGAAKFAKETQKEEENLAKKKKEEEKSAKRAARAAGAAQSAAGQDTNGQGTDGRLVKLSRAMNQLLRHRAASEGVAMDCEGYVSWEDMQALKQFRDFTEEDVRRVVETSDKKRFDIKGGADDGLLIRASQGHSRGCCGKDRSAQAADRTAAGAGACGVHSRHVFARLAADPGRGTEVHGPSAHPLDRFVEQAGGAAEGERLPCRLRRAGLC